MSQRVTRLAPLSGVVFAVLTFVGFFAGGETPDTNATPAKVLAYYAAHRSTIETTSILVAIAFLFAIFWSASLHSYLRRTGGAQSLAALVLAGGVLMFMGASTLAAIEYGLAHEIHIVGPQTAQSLNILSNVLFIPLIAGGCVFGLGSGLAILRGAALPNWLGWVAIVLGVVAVIGPIGFFALLVLLVWTIVASILVYLRSDGDVAPLAPAPAV